MVNVFVWTYFAVSTMASSREAALCPTAQDDSRRPPALEDSITAASDMVLGSHTVTDKRGVMRLISGCVPDKRMSKQKSGKINYNISNQI